MAISPAVDEATTGSVGVLCRLIYDFRLVSVALTVVWLLPHRDDGVGPVMVALLAASLASFVPLMYWNRVGPILLRHPAYLAAEMVLTTLVLLVAGTGSPFFYFTLATALLAGVLYGWQGAALFSTLLVLAAWWAHDIRVGATSEPDTFQALVGLPALYPVFAAAGTAVRRLLRRQAAMDASLANAARVSAAAEERARLAREMHDSVAKTLHGIALSATALATSAARRPEATEAAAQALADSARMAAAEARSLIVDLRGEPRHRDEVDHSVDAEVSRVAEAWAQASGVRLELDVSPVEMASPSSRYELMCILREALANAERHAKAPKVSIVLVGQGREVALTVADNGVGFSPPTRLADLAAGHHFGILGMQERASRAGGRLRLDSAPGRGTRVTVTVPATCVDPVDMKP